MIPKIIHYCWFGGAEKPEIIKKCIDSWKKYCPDYQIIEWNESNFDITSNEYVKEAYEQKKWAFVSDYVRLYALKKMGGIYLDTDCELLKNIDIFLDYDGVVTGYQEEVSIPAAIMFATPNNIWINDMLDYYFDKHFVSAKGKIDLTTNSTIITVLSIKRYGFSIGDNKISYGNVHLYPSIFFGPSAIIKKDPLKDGVSKFDIDVEKTYCVHHGTATWYKKSGFAKFKSFIINIFKKIIGHKNYKKIKANMLKRKYMKVNIK